MRYIFCICDMDRILQQAGERGRENTNDKGILLFSPAATSFNSFLNEFDRGKTFTTLIKNEK